MARRPGDRSDGAVGAGKGIVSRTGVGGADVPPPPSQHPFFFSFYFFSSFFSVPPPLTRKPFPRALEAVMSA